MKQLLLSLLLGWIAHGMLAQNLEDIGRTPPVTINGNVSVGGFYFNSDRIGNRLQPYGFSLAANANLNLYGVDIPFSVVYNEQGRTFSNPFNRFGLSPSYKWATAHLGHRNYNWSPFSIAGQTVLGAGVELNPGKLRVGAFTGQLRQAAGPNARNQLFPQFRRRGFGARLGYGTERSFVDLLVLSGRDDLSSLAGESDSLRASLQAAENVTLGIATRLSFAQDKLYFKADGALSVFTDDIRLDPVDLSEVDERLGRIEDLIAINASTQANYAGEASLNYREQRFGIGLVYRRVMPEFRSFGVNYLLTDLESFTINPFVVLAQQKLRLAGSFGKQLNNLDDRLSSDTERTIGSFSANFTPNRVFGITADYSNYSLYQQVFRDSITFDSVLVDQINHNVSVTPRWTIASAARVQSIVVLLNYQRLADQTDSERLLSNDFVIGNVNYLLNFPQQGWGVRAGLNYFDFNSELFASRQRGVTVGGNKQLLGKALTVSATLAYTVIDRAGAPGSTWGLNGSAAYRVNPKASLTLQVNHLSNALPSTNFAEQRVRLQFRQRW